MEWETTSTILDKLTRYDEDTTWDLLANHFREPIIKLALRMGLDPAQAEDAAQNALLAFAKAYQGGRYDRRRGQLRSWLFTIASNQILDLRRRTAARRGRETPAGEELEARIQAKEHDWEACWEEEWMRAIYARALARVRTEVAPRSFEVLRLSAEDGLSPREIAERLGVPRTTVYNARSRLLRRLNELCREFEEAG